MTKNIQVNSGADTIKAAVDFIETYYGRPITISDIAYEVKLSPGRLAHLFKERMGLTIIEYLTNIRIEKAGKLLLTTDKKCCNLFYEVGYNSQIYFARKFKEVVGISPSQFRACKGKVKNSQR
jgi:two-component system response regulator YesN